MPRRPWSTSRRRTRRREAVAPLALGELEALEHHVQPGLVGAGERAGQDPGAHHHPEVDVLGGRDALVDEHHGLDERLELEAVDDRQSQRVAASISASVRVVALAGLLAELAGLDQLLHLRVDVEAVAVAVVQVLGDVQDRVEPEQVARGRTGPSA